MFGRASLSSCLSTFSFLPAHTYVRTFSHPNSCCCCRNSIRWTDKQTLTVYTARRGLLGLRYTSTEKKKAKMRRSALCIGMFPSLLLSPFEGRHKQKLLLLGPARSEKKGEKKLQRRLLDLFSILPLLRLLLLCFPATFCKLSPT